MRVYLIFAFSLLFLPLEIWGAIPSIPTGVHLADSDCSSCHLTAGSNANQLIAVQEILCADCHEQAIKVSHPSGLTITGSLPAEFPKDINGNLTCSTCHNVHGNTLGLIRVAERGPAFCGLCHDDTFFAAMIDEGQSITHSGHLNTVQQPSGSQFDAYSMKCMECHVTKADIPFTQIIEHTAISENHPIGSAYENSNRYVGYRAVALIDPLVLLPDGLLSCVSCHAGYSKEHGQIVVPAADICFECHDL